MIKKCAICGREFNAPPTSKKITCSKICSAKRKSISHKDKKRNDETKEKMRVAAIGRDMSVLREKGTEAAKKSLKGGRFETNSSAKYWVLLSPDKEIFYVTNLKNWLRENALKFDVKPTEKNVDRLAHGFFTVKRNIKKKEGTITYKGWTLLNWSEEKNCEKK